MGGGATSRKDHHLLGYPWKLPMNANSIPTGSAQALFVAAISIKNEEIDMVLNFHQKTPHSESTQLSLGLTRFKVRMKLPHSFPRHERHAKSF